MSQSARTDDVVSTTNYGSEPVIDEQTVKADGRGHDGQVTGISETVEHALDDLVGRWEDDG